MTNRLPVFAGSVPEMYQKYLVPLILEGYARDLAGRVDVPAGGAVLETACGTGVVTRWLIDAPPRPARIVATDLNPGMLDVARGEVSGRQGIEFQIADATALAFEDGSFDAIVCQFGVMFFPDKDRGYREAARVLKPGGRYCFNVWDTLETNRLPKIAHEIVTALLPENSPDFLALPFSYCDLSEIKDQLQRAGFGDLEITVMPRPSRAPSARDAALALTAGTPLAAQLAERGIAEEALREVEAAVAREFGDGAIEAPMQAIAIVAQLP